MHAWSRGTGYCSSLLLVVPLVLGAPGLALAQPAPDAPPVVSLIAAQLVEGSGTAYHVDAVDPNGRPLTFTWAVEPDGEPLCTNIVGDGPNAFWFHGTTAPECSHTTFHHPNLVTVVVANDRGQSVSESYFGSLGSDQLFALPVPVITSPATLVNTTSPQLGVIGQAFPFTFIEASRDGVPAASQVSGPDGSFNLVVPGSPGVQQIQVTQRIGATPSPGVGLSWYAGPLGNISGRVFDDVNANGQQDAGEPGLSGTEIIRFDDLGNAHTFTDDSGTYSFESLRPGTYHIREVVPTGFAPVGALDFPVTLTAGGTATTNFANFRPDLVTQLQVTPPIQPTSYAPLTLQVDALNAIGGRVTTAANPLTLGKVSGPGNLFGPLNMTPTNGIATFNGVVITAPGHYVLQGSVSGSDVQIPILLDVGNVQITPFLDPLMQIGVPFVGRYQIGGTGVPGDLPPPIITVQDSTDPAGPLQQFSTQLLDGAVPHLAVEPVGAGRAFLLDRAGGLSRDTVVSGLRSFQRLSFDSFTGRWFLTEQVSAVDPSSGLALGQRSFNIPVQLTPDFAYTLVTPNQPATLPNGNLGVQVAVGAASNPLGCFLFNSTPVVAFPFGFVALDDTKSLDCFESISGLRPEAVAPPFGLTWNVPPADLDAGATIFDARPTDTTWRALATVAGPGTGQVAATEPRDIELALLAPAAGGGGGGGCTGVCPPRAADTPELSSFALLASGLASLAGYRLRRRKMHQ